MSKFFKICDKMNLFAPIVSFYKFILLSQLLTSEILLFDLIFFCQKFLFFHLQPRVSSEIRNNSFIYRGGSKKKSERGGRKNFGDSSTLHNTVGKTRFITMFFYNKSEEKEGTTLGPPPKSAYDLCTCKSLLKNGLFYTLTRSGCYIFWAGFSFHSRCLSEVGCPGKWWSGSIFMLSDRCRVRHTMCLQLR